MSKNSITADDILAHLAEMYGDANKYVFASEVSPRTGAWERRIDFLVMNCYESDQLKIQGYEIKISKADLKRELEDPEKHAVFFENIDFYWLIAPSEVVDGSTIPLIPPKWGIRAVSVNDDGVISSRTVRKPTCLHDEIIYKKPLGRGFVASMLRAMSRQSILKAKLLREQRGLREEIRNELEKQIANGGSIVPSWKMESLEKCKRIVDELGLNEYSLELSAKTYKGAIRLLEGIDSASASLRDAKNRIGTVIWLLDQMTAENGKDEGNEV